MNEDLSPVNVLWMERALGILGEMSRQYRCWILFFQERSKRQSMTCLRVITSSRSTQEGYENKIWTLGHQCYTFVNHSFIPGSSYLLWARH